MPSDSTSSAGSSGTRSLPPGPRGMPLLGSYFDVVRDPLSLFEAGARRYGGLVTYRLGPFRFVVANDPEAVAHVLVKNHRNYVKSRSYAGLKLVIGNGLVTSEGELWRRQRKLSQPAFHRARLEGFLNTMARCAEDTVETWNRRSEPVIDVHAEMMRLTLRIVGLTLFSTEVSDDAGKLGRAIAVAIRRANREAMALVRLPRWTPTPLNLRYLQAQRLLDAAIYRIIAERHGATADAEQKQDLLAMLMAATDEGGEGGMSDQQLRDEVMTLFLAGHETTAVALSWTFMLLSRHRDVAARVHEEATRVLGGRTPTLADLEQLQYIGRVVDESMRLYPPAWIIEREALEDDELGGYAIPKGTIVAVCPWTLHRDPVAWPNPEVFDPDRFTPEHSAGRHRYAYLPFGGGPRVCIGNHFALMEAKVLLATIAQRYAVEVDPSFEVTCDPSITLRPKHPMRARLRPIG